MPLHYLPWNEAPPAECRGGTLAIGNFDGVHRGHQALLDELCRQARAVHGPAIAMTFEPPPLLILRPEAYQPPLTSLVERAELIQAAGVDWVLALKTTPELLQLGARDFFQTVVCSHLQARAMVEGSNFAFGHNREGSIETLDSLCWQAGMSLTVVPPLLLDGAVVSSSRVRRAIVQGDVVGGAALLGRPYRLSGTVGAGQRRGQTIGFPTANLVDVVNLLPCDGVYGARVHLAARDWPAAVNIGPNPTFGEQARKVEVHLIGFAGDLYGQSLSIEFIARLRDTRRFQGVAQLVEQLRSDVEQTRRLVEPLLSCRANR
jgi:riboflavin kinase/FMN adenylyltransferase